MRAKLLLLLGLCACGDDGDAPRVGAPVMIVPSKGLPAEAPAMDANNNLDVVRHEGRVYLAWRTAITHFAGVEPVMMVVSSTDEKTWTFETKVALGSDVREPRFLSFDGKLFLYLAQLGKDGSKFEPQGMKMIERTGPGQWTQPVDLYEEGVIPWRTKVVNGKPYMVAYVGGENIYNGQPDPIYIHWLTTTDGRNWTPVVPGKPVVHTGGASETDFVIMDDGALVAVLRNEAGDPGGWGSKLCRAEPSALGEWHCVYDPRKYDSPLLFRRGGKIYLIARRHLTESGYYDLMRRDLSPTEQTLVYLGAYSQVQKRCSIWTVDPETLAVTLVEDLPSRGDTCFPGILEDGDKVIVYNYSSSLDPADPDLAWFAAQNRPTFIYRTVVTGL